MKNSVFQIALLLFFMGVFNLSSSFAQANVCDEEFSYRVEKSESTVKLIVEKKTNTIYNYQLFLIGSNTALIEERENELSSKIIEFSGLKEGEVYLVQVSGRDGCKFTIGGMEGIVIDN